MTEETLVDVCDMTAKTAYQSNKQLAIGAKKLVKVVRGTDPKEIFTVCIRESMNKVDKSVKACKLKEKVNNFGDTQRDKDLLTGCVHGVEHYEIFTVQVGDNVSNKLVGAERNRVLLNGMQGVKHRETCAPALGLQYADSVLGHAFEKDELVNDLPDERVDGLHGFGVAFRSERLFKSMSSEMDVGNGSDPSTMRLSGGTIILFGDVKGTIHTFTIEMRSLD